MSDASWTWYFTPSIGMHGAALEMETASGAVRKITPVMVGPRGEVAFMQWVPIQTGMCDPDGQVFTASTGILFKADDKTVRKLNDLWNLKPSSILLPPGNGFNLLGKPSRAGMV